MSALSRRATRACAGAIATGLRLAPAALGLVIAFTLPLGRDGWAQSVDTNLWVANGQVYSVVRSGGTIYMGGDFDRVGSPTGGGVPIDTSGAVLASFPKVVGSVNAVVSDGAGGWYIGGTFSSVGGLPRSNLARVAPDLSVSAWNPNANGGVYALAISGSIVYVGGNFQSVGGQSRSCIAALDATTGAATSWNPNAMGAVRALAVQSTRVYAGGQFASIGGQLRNRVAALDVSTGAATSWNPNANGIVRTIVPDDTTIYVGGDLTSIGGAARNYAAAINSTSGLARPWNPNFDGPVLTLARRSAASLYAGGSFANVGGQARNYLAEINSSTGIPTSWNPNPNWFVNTVFVTSSAVWVGGIFTSIGGQARNRLAAITATTGQIFGSNPNANSDVLCLAVNGATVFAGGSFTLVGGTVRNNAAAFDAATGLATAWNPNANGIVRALAVSGNTIYAGGDFTNIGGQARNHIAALNTTGAATAWNPNASSAVFTLAIGGSTIYAGGGFGGIGGQTRSFVGALDATTGLAKAWNPAANAAVFALLVNGGNVYAGGSFTTIGGQPRNRIALLDTTAGNALAWNPNADNWVQTIALGTSAIYAGGDFANIGGQSRTRLAALDIATGTATPWNPTADNTVNVLKVSGSIVYAGGGFVNTGGQSRNHLAALDASTGAATAWNPAQNSNPFFVDAIAVTSSTVYAGGIFIRVAGQPQSYIAGIAAVPQILSVEPNHGGNNGAVSVVLHGLGFQSGSTAKLTRSAQGDILGTDITVSASGESLSTTFDLTAKALGLWNVVVTAPDSQTFTLSNGFTVETLRAPELRVDVVGPSSIRANHPAAFDFVIENHGNVDAFSIPLWITGIPVSASVSLGFTSSPPPQGAGEPSWAAVQDTLTSANGRYLPLVIPRVPPGLTTRRLILTVPPSVSSFQLRVATSAPWINDATFLTCLSDAGVIQNVPCVGGQLDTINTYLAANAQLAALNGIGLWARIGWRCDGAATLPGAIAYADQVLGFLVTAIELGTAPPGCGDEMVPRSEAIEPVGVVSSVDPSEKFGPIGAVHNAQTIPYTIWFENEAGASGSARDVTVDDILPTTLDLNSVRLVGAIRVGTLDCSGSNPPCLLVGARTIPFSDYIDLDGPIKVRVTVNFVAPAAITRKLEWKFTTLNDSDGFPPTDPTVGFLPPNVTPPQGEVSVQFAVVPASGTPDGTPIQNSATTTMDGVTQGTNTVSNTLDDAPPSSNVVGLGTPISDPSFMVSWTATNPPPDFQSFTIYVSKDGGPYDPWKHDVTITSAPFTPVPKGHTYTFYSVAHDMSGNDEPQPPSPGYDTWTYSTTAVQGPGGLSLALEGAQPNPGFGVLRVGFTLPSHDRASIELIDIAGRRVLRREVGELGPGRHVVTLSSSPRLRSGLYFLRLAQGDRVLTARVVLMR